MCRAGLQPLCRCGGGNARPPAAGRSLPGRGQRTRRRPTCLSHPGTRLTRGKPHAPQGRLRARPPLFLSAPGEPSQAPPSLRGQLGRGPAGLSAMRGDRLPARLLPRTPHPARHPHPSQRRPRAPWGDTRRGRPVSPTQTSQRGPCRVRGTGRVSKRVGTAAGTRAAQLGRRVFAGRRGRAGARGGARAGLVRAAEALCDRAGRLQGEKTKNKKQSIVQGRDCGRGGRPPILTPGNTGPGVREPHSVQADDSLLRRTTVHPKSRARLADARRRSSRGA